MREQRGVEGRREAAKGRDEPVLKDGLRDGDEQGAAEGLEEIYAGGRLRDQGVRDGAGGKRVLRYDYAGLEADAGAQAVEDEVPEPGGGGG